VLREFERDEAFAPFYISGAVVTLAAALFVVGVYAASPKSRIHPGPLLFWMAVCDGVFAALFIAQYAAPRVDCASVSPLTQTAALASEVRRCARRHARAAKVLAVLLSGPVLMPLAGDPP
jgi:hypothetical protein